MGASDRPTLSSSVISPARRIMLVTPSRIAYLGGFGRPSARHLGSWTFYLALNAPFQLSEEGHPFISRSFALVAPWVSHRVVTADRDIAQILIEPETVDPHELVESLMGCEKRREATAAAIRCGFEQPFGNPEDFDLCFFGEALPTRVLDSRIQKVIVLMAAPGAVNVTAQECALHACLSFSRFMHLFSAETHTTFRRFRAWKRARRLLCMLAGRQSLVEVALDAGYADSTHFCRSVRKCYGYTPSAMSDGVRRLSVIARPLLEVPA